MCLALTARAQAPAPEFDKALFQKYLASPLHNAVVERALKVFPKEVFQKCPALNSPDTTISPVQSITFGPDGVPTAGSWWERFPVKGCVNDTILNLNFFVGKDGKLQMMAGLPGTTHANLLLQHDAIPYATTGPGLRQTDCKQFIIINTRFEGFGLKNPATPDPGEGAKLRPWWETWTLAGCGHTFDVPMDFMPDATGTQIVQKAETITER
jgi:hypothetical protein